MEEGNGCSVDEILVFFVTRLSIVLRDVMWTLCSSSQNHSVPKMQHGKKIHPILSAPNANKSMHATVSSSSPVSYSLQTFLLPCSPSLPS